MGRFHNSAGAFASRPPVLLQYRKGGGDVARRAARHVHKVAHIPYFVWQHPYELKPRRQVAVLCRCGQKYLYCLDTARYQRIRSSYWISRGCVHARNHERAHTSAHVPTRRESPHGPHRIHGVFDVNDRVCCVQVGASGNGKV